MIVILYHSKNVEIHYSMGQNINFFPLQLTAIRNVCFDTYVAFICIIQLYSSFECLALKFLQLLDCVVEKVLPLDVSYSLISCVNVDKKRLKVEPLASLPAPMLPLSCSRSVCLVLSHDGQYPCSSNPLQACVPVLNVFSPLPCPRL